VALAGQRFAEACTTTCGIQVSFLPGRGAGQGSAGYYWLCTTARLSVNSWVLHLPEAVCGFVCWCTCGIQVRSSGGWDGALLAWVFLSLPRQTDRQSRARASRVCTTVQPVQTSLTLGCVRVVWCGCVHTGSTMVASAPIRTQTNILLCLRLVCLRAHSTTGETAPTMLRTA
jgi:hypothetical protein